MVLQARLVPVFSDYLATGCVSQLEAEKEKEKQHHCIEGRKIKGRGTRRVDHVQCRDEPHSPTWLSLAELCDDERAPILRCLRWLLAVARASMLKGSHAHLLARQQTIQQRPPVKTQA